MPVLYLGLFTTPPDAEGNNGVEVSGESYERIPLDLDIVHGVTSDPWLTNTRQVNFHEAHETWGTIVAYGLFDEFGQLLWCAVLDGPVHVTANTTLCFRTNDIKIGPTMVGLKNILRPQGKTLWERLTDGEESD